VARQNNSQLASSAEPALYMMSKVVMMVYVTLADFDVFRRHDGTEGANSGIRRHAG